MTTTAVTAKMPEGLKYRSGDVIGNWTVASYYGDTLYNLVCGDCGEIEIAGVYHARYGLECTRCKRRAQARTSVRIVHIQKAVCKRFALHERELLSERKTARFARPRQLAMALARELTPLSLPAIAARFGRKDHTTVLHSIRAVKERRASSPEWEEHYQVLKCTLLLPQPANDEART